MARTQEYVNSNEIADNQITDGAENIENVNSQQNIVFMPEISTHIDIEQNIIVTDASSLICSLNVSKSDRTDKKIDSHENENTSLLSDTETNEASESRNFNESISQNLTREQNENLGLRRNCREKSDNETDDDEENRDVNNCDFGTQPANDDAEQIEYIDLLENNTVNQRASSNHDDVNEETKKTIENIELQKDVVDDTDRLQSVVEDPQTVNDFGRCLLTENNNAVENIVLQRNDDPQPRSFNESNVEQRGVDNPEKNISSQRRPLTDDTETEETKRCKTVHPIETDEIKELTFVADAADNLYNYPSYSKSQHIIWNCPFKNRRKPKYPTRVKHLADGTVKRILGREPFDSELHDLIDIQGMQIMRDEATSPILKIQRSHNFTQTQDVLSGTQESRRSDIVTESLLPALNQESMNHIADNFGPRNPSSSIAPPLNPDQSQYQSLDTGVLHSGTLKMPGITAPSAQALGYDNPRVQGMLNMQTLNNSISRHVFRSGVPSLQSQIGLDGSYSYWWQDSSWPLNNYSTNIQQLQLQRDRNVPSAFVSYNHSMQTPRHTNHDEQPQLRLLNDQQRHLQNPTNRQLESENTNNEYLNDSNNDVCINLRLPQGHVLNIRCDPQRSNNRQSQSNYMHNESINTRTDSVNSDQPPRWINIQQRQSQRRSNFPLIFRYMMNRFPNSHANRVEQSHLQSRNVPLLHLQNPNNQHLESDDTSSEEDSTNTVWSNRSQERVLNIRRDAQISNNLQSQSQYVSNESIDSRTDAVQGDLNPRPIKVPRQLQTNSFLSPLEYTDNHSLQNTSRVNRDEEPQLRLFNVQQRNIQNPINRQLESENTNNEYLCDSSYTTRSNQPQEQLLNIRRDLQSSNSLQSQSEQINNQSIQARTVALQGFQLPRPINMQQSPYQRQSNLPSTLQYTDNRVLQISTHTVRDGQPLLRSLTDQRQHLQNPNNRQLQPGYMNNESLRDSTNAVRINRPQEQVLNVQRDPQISNSPLSSSEHINNQSVQCRTDAVHCVQHPPPISAPVNGNEQPQLRPINIQLRQNPSLERVQRIANPQLIPGTSSRTGAYHNEPSEPRQINIQQRQVTRVDSSRHIQVPLIERVQRVGNQQSESSTSSVTGTNHGQHTQSRSINILQRQHPSLEPLQRIANPQTEPAINTETGVNQGEQHHLCQINVQQRPVTRDHPSQHNQLPIFQRVQHVANPQLEAGTGLVTCALCGGNHGEHSQARSINIHRRQITRDHLNQHIQVPILERVHNDANLQSAPGTSIGTGANQRDRTQPSQLYVQHQQVTRDRPNRHIQLPVLERVHRPLNLQSESGTSTATSANQGEHTQPRQINVQQRQVTRNPPNQGIQVPSLEPRQRIANPQPEQSTSSGTGAKQSEYIQSRSINVHRRQDLSLERMVPIKNLQSEQGTSTGSGANPHSQSRSINVQKRQVARVYPNQHIQVPTLERDQNVTHPQLEPGNSSGTVANQGEHTQSRATNVQQEQVTIEQPSQHIQIPILDQVQRVANPQSVPGTSTETVSGQNELTQSRSINIQQRQITRADSNPHIQVPVLEQVHVANPQSESGTSVRTGTNETDTQPRQRNSEQEQATRDHPNNQIQVPDQVQVVENSRSEPGTSTEIGANQGENTQPRHINNQQRHAPTNHPNQHIQVPILERAQGLVDQQSEPGTSRETGTNQRQNTQPRPINVQQRQVTRELPCPMPALSDQQSRLSNANRMGRQNSVVLLVSQPNAVQHAPSGTIPDSQRQQQPTSLSNRLTQVQEQPINLIYRPINLIQQPINTEARLMNARPNLVTTEPETNVQALSSISSNIEPRASLTQEVNIEQSPVESQLQATDRQEQRISIEVSYSPILLPPSLSASPDWRALHLSSIISSPDSN